MRRMQARDRGIMTVLTWLWTVPATLAGDRLGVSEVVRALPAPWTDAYFSIDVEGLSKDGEATLEQSLRVEHEAALPGYLTYLRVSSHGDLSLFRTPASPGSSRGTDSYVVKPPLGGEQIVVLFSTAPLDQLFPAGTNSRELGSDRASAEAFARQLAQLESGGIRVASRRFAYAVSTVAGGTEYTTRSIIRRVEETPQRPLAGGAAAKIPGRIEFEFDSDRLTEQGKRDLDMFGEAMVSKLSDRSVMLEGHTDSVGSDEYNVSLSARRAQAAREYLMQSFGIPAAKLAAVGKGKSEPIASNSSDSERGHNRRVDFVFYDSPQKANP